MGLFRKIEFGFILISFGLVVMALAAGISSVAKSMAAEASVPASSITVADGIPPNCLLDPWTHKLVCVTWPTQTTVRQNVRVLG